MRQTRRIATIALCAVTVAKTGACQSQPGLESLARFSPERLLAYHRQERTENEAVYVLWGEGFPLGDNVMAVIPVAQIIYPDGTNLEGVGVKPDQVIELEKDDLLNGVDTQLQAAVDFLRSNINS